MKIEWKKWIWENIENAGLQRYDYTDFDADDKRDQIIYFEYEVMPLIIEHCNSNFALDVGCGNGRMSNQMSYYFNNIIAIDPYRQLNSVHLTSKIQFISTSIEEYETENKFDLILFWGVFYMMYYSDYQKVFDKCAAMLNQDGVIVIAGDKLRTLKNKNEPGHYNVDKLSAESKLKIIEDIIVHDYYRTFLIKKIK